MNKRLLDLRPEFKPILSRGTLYPTYLIKFHCELDYKRIVLDLVLYLLKVELGGPYEDLTKKGLHPDLLLIDADSYNPESISGLSEFKITNNIILDVPKIVIIHNIDRMSVPLQNKLLKSLEDTIPNLVFLLTTSNSSKVIPTIHSRSVPISFYKPTYESFLESFSNLGLEVESAKVYYKVFNGNFDHTYYGSDLGHIRGVLYRLFTLTVHHDNLYQLLLPLDGQKLTLKALLDSYPFESLMRILKSFFLDKLLLLTGEKLVRYNEDYQSQIEGVGMTLNCVNKILSKLQLVRKRSSSKFNHIWLRGVILDV